MTDTSLLLEAVTDLARETGRTALEFFRRNLETQIKSDGSPVTEADLRAESLARAWIHRRFPGDAIVGEEYGEESAATGTRWIVDPIDGTRSFVRGVPLWGSLVAVEVKGEILAGAAFFPATGELISASVGCGCWLNGSRCSVSTVSDIAAATVLTTDDRFPSREERRRSWNVLAARAATARTWGDAYGYMLVASGRAEVMVDDMCSIWDIAPMLPIIGEAGGLVTDFRGNTTATGGCAIATNDALKNEVRTILHEG